VQIKTVKDLGAALKAGPYAWPGGYPIFFVTADGGALSFATVWEERKIIARAIADGDDAQWRVVASDVNWEDAELFDDHSGNRIESAYAEDDAEGKPDVVSSDFSKWQTQVRRRGTFG
jgi:hypothetical protein